MRGTVKNTLKGGGTGKMENNKDFKNGGEARSRAGCLKKRGWNPPTNYATFEQTS